MRCCDRFVGRGEQIAIDKLDKVRAGSGRVVVEVSECVFGCRAGLLTLSAVENRQVGFTFEFGLVSPRR